jgi:ribosomal protein S18 acetylase RimI-like enzyme
VPIAVRDLDGAAWAWADEVLADVGGRLVARRGTCIDLATLPALVAESGGERVGILVYDPGEGRGEAELAALATPVRGVGAGTALIETLRRRLPDRPIWVVTTNDNTAALRFYQRRGFVLRTLRARAVDAARRSIKPAIPRLGNDGIRIRDELELVLQPLSSAPSDDA